jgi:hypothetical protein
MRDLFGEVPVTISDVELWLDRIVNYCGSSARVEYYVLNWNVADKIRRAKLEGRWCGYVEQSDNRDLFSFAARRMALRVAYHLCERPDQIDGTERRSRAASMAHSLQTHVVYDRLLAHRPPRDVGESESLSQLARVDVLHRLVRHRHTDRAHHPSMGER